MQSDFTFPGIVIALLNVPLDGTPGDLWRAVHGAVTTWEPVEPAEAAILLAEAKQLVHDPLTDGQPPTWQWNVSETLEILERMASNDHVTVSQVLHVVRVNLVAHRWHLDHRGSDRFEEIRWRFVDMLGRLLMDLKPTDWESALMERTEGLPIEATVGQLIKHRRQAQKLTQTALADHLGVVRYSVSNWERGRARPTAANAAALTEILGGEPIDYLRS